MANYNAFTLPGSSLLDTLKTTCSISKAISILEINSGVPHPDFKDFTAIWDTGASSSAISPRVVGALGLIPTGKGECETAAGRVEVDKYSINIKLPNGVAFSSLQVSCNNMNVDVLIGMDIISKGDFCITNKDGKTLFTFQIPSSHETDYVKEINQLNKYNLIHLGWLKHGNNLCPCGSGKQWEKCHGSKA